jgi:osmoprotectant transport system permease protein
VSELVRGIPPLLASHLVLALVALAIASAISLPLAMVASSRPRLAFVVTTIAGVIQTVPGLALLALMVPILAQLRWVSSFGFPPAVLALTLYAILPILRNAVTGLVGVEPAIVEAARGMGMTDGQIMRQVQLPLAAPVIAAGVRIATVWTVGAATLATPIGQACLGNYIFTGLQTRNFAMLLVGVATAAALALVLDALLYWAERSLAGRTPRRALIPAGVLAVLVAIVIGVLPRLASDRTVTSTAIAGTTRDAVTTMRLGGKTFTEQYVLVELIRGELERAGIVVELVQSLGSTVVFDALVAGDLDAYVDYSGTLWTNAMHRASGPPRWQVLAELEGWLAREHGVRSVGTLGFENTYALAVRRETATKLGLATLRDLAGHRELSVGGDYEFFGRAEWTAVQRTYGLRFTNQATFDPTLLYEAIARRQVDVISAFSSDGRIAANDLVVLADPLGALPPYDAMLLVGRRAAADPRVECALSGITISVDDMQRANALVDHDRKSPAEAAAWLRARLGARRDCRP